MKLPTDSEKIDLYAKQWTFNYFYTILFVIIKILY